MTSRQHQDWLNRGKPDSGLALPLQLLANTLAAAGYTVYVYPNDAHLDAQPPEDHTYYSETGWPGVSPKWWRHAIDIMPPPPGSGLPSLQTLGQRIFDARQAGRITWLKYMNWPSDGNLNRAVQDRWKPDHSRGSSSDTGHIHISSVTGCETLGSTFNPLTSVVVTGVVTQDGGLTVAASDVIEAWANGNPMAPTGETVQPVLWRKRDEAWQAAVTSALAKASAPTVTVDPAAVAGQLAASQPFLTALASAVAAQLKGQIDAAVEARLNGATLTLSAKS